MGTTDIRQKSLFLKMDWRRKYLWDAKKFKDLPVDSAIKKVFLKNEDTPMQRKENDRLYGKLRELIEAEEDPENPENRYYIKSGKLHKNDIVIDEFSLDNQLFQ